MVKKYSCKTFSSTSPFLKESEALNANSLEPPPPGITPTPNSTKPIYVSAAATTLSACNESSHPPPKVIPCGAETVGIDE